MRSVHLIVALGATLVRGIPLQRRVLDFDFGGGSSDPGNSLNDFDSFSVGVAGGLWSDSEGFQVADNTFANGDLSYSSSDDSIITAENIDTLPAIDYSAVAPQENLGAVAKNLDSGTGTGDLNIDFVAPPPDLGSDTALTSSNLEVFNNNPVVFSPEDNNVAPLPLAGFTPTEAGLTRIDATDNVNPADIGSSRDDVPGS